MSVLSGDLRPGDRLPPIRELAKYLKVNPNTVARAYASLEAEGFLLLMEGMGKSGFFDRKALYDY